MTKSHGIITRTIWSDTQVNTLRAQYPNRKTSEIAAELGMKPHVVYAKAASLGLKKSAEFYASTKSGRTNGNQGKGTRFVKGQASWNKGRKGVNYEGMKATQFRPNQAAHNLLPVGHIRTNSDGYLDIKTAPGARKWVALHRWNWMQAHGAYPARGMALIFRDGNRLNCDISNLELVSRKELMSKNTVHTLPKELAQLVLLRGALNRKISRINRRANHEQQ